jgi:hypothetical protein
MDTESDRFSNDGRALATSDPNVELLPRFTGRRPSLRSLTGTARESASLYVAWKKGVIQRGDYMAGIRGLAVHKDVLVAVEHERMRIQQGEMQQQLEEILSRPQQPQYGYESVVGDVVAP